MAALTILLHTVKETDKLNSLPLCTVWPVYYATFSKVVDDIGNKSVGVRQELECFDEAQQYYTRHCKNLVKV